VRYERDSSEARHQACQGEGLCAHANGHDFRCWHRECFGRVTAYQAIEHAGDGIEAQADSVNSGKRRACTMYSPKREKFFQLPLEPSRSNNHLRYIPTIATSAARRTRGTIACPLPG
jgi:hypothetical protein